MSVPSITLRGRRVEAKRPLRLAWQRWLENNSQCDAGGGVSDRVASMCAAIGMVYADPRWKRYSEYASLVELGDHVFEALSEEGLDVKQIVAAASEVITWATHLLFPEAESEAIDEIAGNSSAPSQTTGQPSKLDPTSI